MHITHLKHYSKQLLWLLLISWKLAIGKAKNNNRYWSSPFVEISDKTKNVRVQRNSLVEDLIFSRLTRLDINCQWSRIPPAPLAQGCRCWSHYHASRTIWKATPRRVSYGGAQNFVTWRRRADRLNRSGWGTNWNVSSFESIAACVHCLSGWDWLICAGSRYTGDFYTDLFRPTYTHIYTYNHDSVMEEIKIIRIINHQL